MADIAATSPSKSKVTSPEKLTDQLMAKGSLHALNQSQLLKAVKSKQVTEREIIHSM